MAQANLKPITIESAVGSPEFAKGVSEYALGLPLATLSEELSFNYERGRQFAALLKGRLASMPPRGSPDFRRLVRAFRTAYQRGDIL